MKFNLDSYLLDSISESRRWKKQPDGNNHKIELIIIPCQTSIFQYSKTDYSKINDACCISQGSPEKQN